MICYSDVTIPDMDIVHFLEVAFCELIPFNFVGFLKVEFCELIPFIFVGFLKVEFCKLIPFNCRVNHNLTQLSSENTLMWVFFPEMFTLNIS